MYCWVFDPLCFDLLFIQWQCWDLSILYISCSYHFDYSKWGQRKINWQGMDQLTLNIYLALSAPVPRSYSARPSHLGCVFVFCLSCCDARRGYVQYFNTKRCCQGEANIAISATALTLVCPSCLCRAGDVIQGPAFSSKLHLRSELCFHLKPLLVYQR